MVNRIRKFILSLQIDNCLIHLLLTSLRTSISSLSSNQFHFFNRKKNSPLTIQTTSKRAIQLACGRRCRREKDANEIISNVLFDAVRWKSRGDYLHHCFQQVYASIKLNWACLLDKRKSAHVHRSENQHETLLFPSRCVILSHERDEKSLAKIVFASINCREKNSYLKIVTSYSFNSEQLILVDYLFNSNSSVRHLLENLSSFFFQSSFIIHRRCWSKREEEEKKPDSTHFRSLSLLIAHHFYDVRKKKKTKPNVIVKEYKWLLTRQKERRRPPSAPVHRYGKDQ